MPHVVLIVGVNGTGKTTTVGKLASLAKRERRAAADLRGGHVPRGGRRPAPDLGDPRGRRHHPHEGRRRSGGGRLRRGRRPARRAASPILVDTAGRLHTRANLMQELEKIRRIAAREVPGAPHEVLIVLDATVGQNGLVQAQQFMDDGRRHRRRPHET